MAEELIKARIVFDTSAIEKASRGVGGGGGGGGIAGGVGSVAKNIAQIATGVAIGNKIADTVTNLMNKLVQSSPVLQNSIAIMRKSFEFILRPIGDTIGKMLRPVALFWLRYALKFYREIAPQMGKWFENIAKAISDTVVKPAAAGQPGGAQEAASAEFVAKQQEVMADKTMSLGEKLMAMMPPALVETVAALGDALLALWNALVGLATMLYSALKPAIDGFLEGLKALAFLLGLALLGALKVLTIAFIGLEAVLTILQAAFLWAAENFQWFWGVLSDFIVWIAVEGIAWLIKAWDKIKTFFTVDIPAAWDTLKAKIGSVMDSIKSAVSGAVSWVLDKLAKLNPFKKSETTPTTTTKVQRDFMVRGNTVIPFSPQDTIIGTQGGLPGGGTNVTININALDARSINDSTLRLITDAIDRAQRRGVMSRTMQAAGS